MGAEARDERWRKEGGRRTRGKRRGVRSESSAVSRRDRGHRRQHIGRKRSVGREALGRAVAERRTWAERRAKARHQRRSVGWAAYEDRVEAGCWAVQALMQEGRSGGSGARVGRPA
jgi:hypothetical protein